MEELTAQSLLRERRPAPQTGWRHAVYTLTAHAVNPGQSPEDRRREELIARATVPVAGCYRVAVISLKGGVGKTTTPSDPGATLATLRGDRVIAVDANPDRGTLSDKIRLETAATVRDLLNERRSGSSATPTCAPITSQSADRLEVLASDRDPRCRRRSARTTTATSRAVLEHFYSICITDCGTGLLHSAMARRAAAWPTRSSWSARRRWTARGAPAPPWTGWRRTTAADLVRNGRGGATPVRPKCGRASTSTGCEHHFAARCRAVARIPYDPHLEEGAEIDLGELSGASRSSLLELAAHVADAFPRLPRGPYGPGA